VSRIKLRSGDISLLERLNSMPLEIGNLPNNEIGNLPNNTIERLMALGLVTKELGCCEITRNGQLTLHRQQFLKASGRRIARVMHRNSMFLQEATIGTSLSRPQSSEHQNLRRRLDAPIRQAMRLPQWLTRLASETAGRFSPADKTPSKMAGMANLKLKQKAH
jgi:hypothetical protein